MKQASHRLVVGSIFFCMDQSKDLEERKSSGVHIIVIHIFILFQCVAHFTCLSDR